MDFNEHFTNCQTILYRGYTTKSSSGKLWLNEFCTEFLKCCNILHKFLIFECSGKSEIIEIIFLCLNQIICCVKYLEKTIKTEEISGVVLSTSRQYFLDRILWCFARLKSTINSAKDNVRPASLEETNFVELMDEILLLITPYSAYQNDEEIVNKAEFNAEALFVSKKIRTAVDSIIGQTLAFANVAMLRDKPALSALCQKVLRECIEFQEECSLSKDHNTIKTNDPNRNLKAVLLENALCQLENFLNESLLRLVYKIFIDYSEQSVNNLRNLMKQNPNDSVIDDKIAEFDCNIDRIMQVGMFAIAFSPNVQVKTTVRSTLASLESLDAFLIPSLYSQCDLHSTLLEEHFHEEITNFHNCLQQIIDTNAFCTSYLEILNLTIEICDKEFNKENIYETLEMGKMLKENFQVNSRDLQIDNNQDNKLKYDNFNLMLNECLAILSCAEQVESSKIIKRLKIFRSCLKKLHNVICRNENNNDLKTEKKYENNNVFIMSEDLSESKKMFESFGISPSVAQILYQSRRERKNTTSSLIANTSKLYDEETLENLRISEKKNIKRNVSLRTAMFKRQKSNETANIYKIYNENSTNLEITDILDQLTSLSSTFSNITQTDGCISSSCSS